MNGQFIGYKRVLLIGTFNKILEYSKGINFELQCLFWKHLNECNNLIVSGYSFGDKGINARVVNWMYKKRERRIIIINPDINKLYDDSRGTIRNNWIPWQKNKALRVIPNMIQVTDLQKIKDELALDNS